MSLTIEVREAKIETKSGVSRKTGKPYTINEQPAFVSLPTGETRRVVLQHEDGDKALDVGRYVPSPSAYWVGDFGALSISTRAKHWEPATAARPASAARPAAVG